MPTNKEIIEGAYASFAQGDVPAALGVMADNIQWTELTGSLSLAPTLVRRPCSKASSCDSGRSAMTLPWCPSSSSPTVTPSSCLATTRGSTRAPESRSP